jgi:hypothetical protein
MLVEHTIEDLPPPGRRSSFLPRTLAAQLLSLFSGAVDMVRSTPLGEL